MSKKTGGFMENLKIRVSILEHLYLKEDGTFDKNRAIKLAGQIAGECYDEEGIDVLLHEPEERTMKRVNRTLNNNHHSVYDHEVIKFNFKNLPKILAMVLNNEHQYTTSEKSARYTPIKKIEGTPITDNEIRLYNKWLEIFKIKIKEEYGNVYNDSKITKLAQENARYLVTVFMPTQMVYTTTFRQINLIASWMMEYIENAKTDFEVKLALSMKDFLIELERLNVLDERLMKNEKYRKFSLFGKDLDKREEHFGYVYSTTYDASLACLAQAHRHRTLDYQMEMNEVKEYYVPPIIEDDGMLKTEWINDMNSVKEVVPQGELVKIHESGKYDDFILKCKERICTEAQLEIMRQTRETLLKYKEGLEMSNSYLLDDIEKYTHGARCTFPDYNCASDCKFKEGKNLTRKI